MRGEGREVSGNSEVRKATLIVPLDTYGTFDAL